METSGSERQAGGKFAAGNRAGSYPKSDKVQTPRILVMMRKVWRTDAEENDPPEVKRLRDLLTKSPDKFLARMQDEEARYRQRVVDARSKKGSEAAAGEVRVEAGKVGDVVDELLKRWEDRR